MLFLGKENGDASFRLYFDYPAAGPLAGPPLLADVAQAGAEFERAFPVPKGQYFVVFDNTSTAGTVSPPMNALDDRAAVVNYVVQVGDAP